MGKIFVSLISVILLAACGSVVYKPVVKIHEKLQYAKEISNDEPTEIVKVESINIAKITDILSQFPVKNPEEVNIQSYVTNIVNKKADFFEPFKDGLLVMGKDPAGFWTTCHHVSYLKYNGQWESIFKESTFGNYPDYPSMNFQGNGLYITTSVKEPGLSILNQERLFMKKCSNQINMATGNIIQAPVW